MYWLPGYLANARRCDSREFNRFKISSWVHKEDKSRCTTSERQSSQSLAAPGEFVKIAESWTLPGDSYADNREGGQEMHCSSLPRGFGCKWPLAWPSPVGNTAPRARVEAGKQRGQREVAPKHTGQTCILIPEILLPISLFMWLSALMKWTPDRQGLSFISLCAQSDISFQKLVCGPWW